MLEVAYVLKKTISALVLPPTVFLLLIIFGMLVMAKHKRTGRFIISSSVVLAFLLSTSIVSGHLLSTLQNFSALDPKSLPRADAIVILAGGIREHAIEYGSDQLNSFTLERLRYGAWLAKRTGLPILVTGGYRYDGPTEAQVMAAALKEEYGLTARWVESDSRDTADNARLSAVLLREAKLSRILLVTHAWHMRRAVAEFAAMALVVVPAPTAFAKGFESWRVNSLIPNANDFYASSLAMHELLGLLWARLKG